MHRRISGNDNHNMNEMDAANGSKLSVDLAHVGEYDTALLGLLLSQPAAVLPALELAAEDALKSLLYDLSSSNNTEGETRQNADAAAAANNGNTTTTQNQGEHANSAQLDGMTRVQILLKGNLAPTPLRSIKAEHMNRLIKCPGIVISTSPPKSRATQLMVRCSRCLHTQIISVTGGPYGGVSLPRHCAGDDSQQQCGLFPYSVVPDESHFVDRQNLKLQESPETVPTGEMPRSVLMAVERSLVDRAPPGTRVQVLCIPTLFHKINSSNNGSGDSVRTVYLRVVGLARDHAPGESATFSPREEEAFRLLSKRSDVYDILSRSIAPSISGSYTVDIKKAICTMLFGGTRKRLPDGVRLRGDINVLLLGDPSTAKSQFLKFTSRVAPVGIYTSGKGSSAAGLTASIVKDARGEFYLEGGAMVLADGGIVAIDEFDKMRPNDRVAIHEAMEQQTISIAKAGITTVLNSRSSVLAAANPVFGRYDDLKSASENIDLMTTILSRFDLIFLVRDVREEERDRMICKHVMGVHITNSRGDGLDNSRNLLSRQLEEDDPLERYVVCTHG
jgi:DNA replication licensing factor MCM5